MFAQQFSIGVHFDANLSIPLLNYSFKVGAQNTFWTTTIWTTDVAMKDFMLSGVHRRVMRKLPLWCDEAAVVHWTQESTEAPTWAEAHARLRREGRPSKVNHPSPAHTAYEFPEPRVPATAELRFK